MGVLHNRLYKDSASHVFHELCRGSHSVFFFFLRGGIDNWLFEMYYINFVLDEYLTNHTRYVNHTWLVM